jgi:hypothetical protein
VSDETIKIPLPRDPGQAVYVRPVDPATECDVHALDDGAACDALRTGMTKAGGINACRGCIERCRDHLRRKCL